MVVLEQRASVRDVEGSPLPEMVIAVLEDARGRGVGTRLVNALAEEAARLPFNALTLTGHLRNPAARLYMRTGFRVAGARRGSFGGAMIRPLREICTSANTPIRQSGPS